MQPTLNHLRQLLVHMGVGLAARHDPEPGLFPREIPDGPDESLSSPPVRDDRTD